MIYNDNPQKIIFDNRRRTPTLEELTVQVISLARIAVDLQSCYGRLDSLENMLVPLQTKPLFTNPNRTVDTDFVISTTRNAIVNYTVDLEVTASLLGNHTNKALIQLMINDVVIVEVNNNLTAVITLGLSLNPIHRHTLTGIVPMGSTVNLKTSLTGNADVTLIQTQEVLL